MAGSFRTILGSIIESVAMQADKTIILSSADPLAPSKRPSRARLAIAFGVAAVSDLFAIFTTIAPPAQVALDVGTAAVLFLILGRRWALLPGLIAEAIPGMGVFPVWILVVLSIAIYDGIKRPPKS
jgi:predicted membrane metal-binding protein